MHYELEPYSDHRPTVYDVKGLALPDQQDWLVVPVSQTRDSEHLEKSNFDTACAWISDAANPKESQYEVHGFNHWACGWYEIILVKPNTPCHSVARNICEQLNGYPVLDESDWCNREHEDWSEQSYQGVCRILDSEWQTLGGLDDNADEFYEAVLQQLPDWTLSNYASDDDIREAIHTVAATGEFKFDQ